MLIYFAAGFSFLVGLYAMPFAIAMFKMNYRMENLNLIEKIQNIFTLLLVLSFPLVNFISAAEILFLKSYTMSNVSACIGALFILFYFLDMLVEKPS